MTTIFCKTAAACCIPFVGPLVSYMATSDQAPKNKYPAVRFAKTHLNEIEENMPLANDPDLINKTQQIYELHKNSVSYLKDTLPLEVPKEKRSHIYSMLGAASSIVSALILLGVVGPAAPLSIMLPGCFALGWVFSDLCSKYMDTGFQKIEERLKRLEKNYPPAPA